MSISSINPHDQLPVHARIGATTDVNLEGEPDVSIAPRFPSLYPPHSALPLSTTPYFPLSSYRIWWSVVSPWLVWKELAC